METKNFNVKEPIHVTAEKMNEIAKPKKEQKVSVSYTLKAMKNNIDKLIENKIITAEDGKTMTAIHKKAVQHWIGLEMGI